MKSRLMPTILCCGALLLGGCISGGGEEADQVKNHIDKGDEIPAFNGMEGWLDGVPMAEALDSNDFTERRGLIFFFASYCPVCQRFLGVIEDVWQEMRYDEGVLIAPISRQGNGENHETVAAYWASEDAATGKQPYTMPYYIDEGRRLYDQFANLTIPRLYLIDSQRRVTHMWIGSALPDDPQEIIALLHGDLVSSAISSL